ncbi:hypothetical protein NDU88_004209 [Pleurodeles waltl]|uniref:Uncharacterized protein n=1 Tax=Pleurodeles waltl TaxID=8319 RepID=A0AAV7M5Q6_PLEWA|nr:hypothetical protein NDU88_004209 [Pleurodeles waltl]
MDVTGLLLRLTPLREWGQQESAFGGTPKSYIRRSTHANLEIEVYEAAPGKEERDAKKEDTSEKEPDDEEVYGRDTGKGDTGPRDPGKEEDMEKRKEGAGKREESVGGPGKAEGVGEMRSQAKEFGALLEELT